MPSGSSKRSQDRATTNIFDAIRKPPSVAMEKIQTSTAATLDRMAVLQQRYRQHKEAMNSDNSSDKSRRTSTTSTIDSNVSSPNRLRTLPHLNVLFIRLQSLFHFLSAHPFRLNLLTITNTTGRALYEETTASHLFQIHRNHLNVTQIM